MDEINQPLGPLPHSDHNHEIQRESVKALNALLAGFDGLILRDERVEDYGVDASFELKIDTTPTNIRAQIQLKGTESPETHADGSISLQVDVANLNYLLNGSSPVYLLFNLRERRFYFVWGHDELRRLERENPNWRHQKKVVIHFRQPLSPKDLPLIVGRILKEGQLARNIHDALARSTITETVTISVDAETLRTTDGIKAYSIIRQAGCAIVASGFAAEAIRLFQLLNETQRSDPKIQLVGAYAEYTRGRLQAALGHVAEAQLRQAELPANDRVFIKSLKLASEFRTGKIDSSEYLIKFKELQKECDGDFSRFQALETLRQEFLSNRDISVAEDRVGEIQKAVKELDDSPTAEAPLKLSARLILIFAEGSHHAMRHVDFAFRAHMAGKVSADPRRMLAEQAQISEIWKKWEASATGAIGEAVKLKHPNLLAEALLTRAFVQTTFLMGTQNFEAAIYGTRKPPPSPVCEAIAHDIKCAHELFQKAEMREGVVRADLLLADLLEISGRLNEAIVVARKVAPIADTMGYHEHLERANDLLTGATLLMDVDKKLRNPVDQDVAFAISTDVEIRKFAQDMAKIEGLPIDRLPIIERDCFATRDGSKERVEWCEHFEILQDLRHLAHMSTKFREDPNRICKCSLFKFQSPKPAKDWKLLVPEFKSTFCHACNSRSPKANRLKGP